MRLDLCGCDRLTDAGLAAALSDGAPHLTQMNIKCTELTTRGVRAALDKSKLSIRKLNAHGVRTSRASLALDASGILKCRDLEELRRTVTVVKANGTCRTGDLNGAEAIRVCNAAADIEMSGLNAFCRGCWFYFERGRCCKSEPEDGGTIASVWLSDW
jgi:hypothetical protein